MMNDLQRLKYMGIRVWELRHPEFYSEQQALTDLPESCRLLFVSEVIPTERDAWLFGKIIASMQISPEEVLYLPPYALSQLGSHRLSWCWFAGCAVHEMTQVQIITSPSLAALQDDIQAKKSLWHQIKSAAIMK